MQIAIIDPEVDSSLIMSYLNPEHTLFLYDEEHDTTTIDVMIIRSQTVVDTALLDTYTQVKCICRVWVGLEKVDRELCKARDIQVINTPWANSGAVAELAIWALLDMCRTPRVSYTDISAWRIEDRSRYIGKQIADLTIWYIWFGNVGKQIAQRLVWYASVWAYYYDPYVEGSYYGVEKITERDKLFEASDVLIIVAPLFAATQHTINPATLALCKEDVMILNMSRWWLVDETALYTFMQTHTQASFFADVREGEPEITDSLQQLLKLPNVTITNHIWSWTHTAIAAMHYFEILA